MSPRTLKVWLLTVTAALLLAALAAAPLASRAGSAPPTPAQAVQQAWQRARDLGTYRFTTDLTATAYPAPALANAGRTAQEERLHLEGSVDLPASTVLLSLWQGAGSVLNRADGVEVRIEGDRAYGRQVGGRWQEVDDFSGGFAPGGDLLVYLVGAKNVVELGTETLVVPMPEGAAGPSGDGLAGMSSSILIEYTRYGFELDGPAVAEEVRQQWQAELLKQGGLPAGVEVQAPAELHDAAGHGELWVDADGLPARMILDIAYPPDAAKGDAGGRGTIRTDFSGFPPHQSAQAPRLVAALGLSGLRVPDPAGWLADRVDVRRMGAQAALFLAMAGLSLLVVLYRRSRSVYAAIVLVIVLSMVITPLAESQRTAAYGEQQAAQRAAYEKRQAEARAVNDYRQAMHTNQWDPFQDPLAASEQIAALEGGTGLQETGQPGAGEGSAPLLGPYQVTEVVQEENEPAPDSDLDSDTLTYIEEQRLSTNPDNADTDGDQLRDEQEVKGFDYTDPKTQNTRHYYIDPLSVDTNSDGLSDMQECWTTVPATLPSATACDLDTDQDGTPDLFDPDNDGDGVEDATDMSPFSSMGVFSGGANSAFQLVLNHLEIGVPTFVDLQLRPTTAAHLSYAMNVLDWPSGDTDGQVQRVLDTTFADSMTEEEVAKDPRAANGDLRLIPMAEITVPYYTEGHTRNLPVKPGWTGTLTATTPLEDWVDTDMLEQYGMTAGYADDTGTVVLYAPLSLVTDEAGGASVAFSTRLPYQPVSADWGKAHQVRVVWMLQMLVDQCKELPVGEDAKTWCSRPENREQQTQVVHTYDESWVLTGLDVREDHGLEMAIAYEDPAHDTDKEDDRWLWSLAYDLDQTWITARDCDTVDSAGNCVGNSQRDLNVPEIVHRFDNGSNGDIPDGDARLWGIRKDALQVWTQDFAYQDLTAAVPMTHTKEILNGHFTQNGQAVTEAPTLLFIREEHYRSANLDSQAEVASRSTDGRQLTVNLLPQLAPLDTMAAMSWMPYRFRDGAWEPYPMEEYMEVLEPRLRESLPVDVDPNDPDAQAIEDGQVIGGRSYYLGMTQGTQQVVQSNNTPQPLYGGPPPPRDQTLKENSVKVAGDVLLNILRVWDDALMQASGYLADIFGMWWAGGSRGDAWRAIGAIPQKINANGGWWGWGKINSKWTLGWNVANVATTIATGLCAILLFVVSCFCSAPAITYVQNGLKMVAGVVRFVAAAVTALEKGLAGNWTKWSRLQKVNVALMMVVEVLVLFGVFLVQWAGMGWQTGTAQFHKILFEMIGKILASMLLYLIYLIPVVGKAIFLLIKAIDSIMMFICGFFSKEYQQSEEAAWWCKGITGLLGQTITWIFFSASDLIYFGDDERWYVNPPSTTLSMPTVGMAVGNSLGYQLTLTNSIRLADLPNDWKAQAYAWQWNDDNLKQASFGYDMSGQETADLHSNRRLDEIGPEWAPDKPRDGKQTYYIVREIETAGAGLPLAVAGINTPPPTYIHEGYAAPLQECIAVPTPPMGVPLVPVCWINEDKLTLPADMAASLIWDVFPENLTKFYEHAGVAGGYSLAWGQSGDVRFGRQKDFDGDSLINGADGGPDSNDVKWDADSDGLSDSFELQVGSKHDELGGYDPDGDGLNDRDELLLGTDPFKADSDGDGLTDRQEREGWEFAYGFDAAGKPKITWVTSDPLLVDADGDTLTDFQEYNYRYHPFAASDPNVLGFSSELSELTSSGSATPSDGLVRSGDRVRYEATVENKTALSSAQGLHAARIPAGLSGSSAARTFLLYPQERETLSGDLSVLSDAPSGPADLVQTAGARITYALADSDYAQLVLHLEDASTATAFADSSGNVPPHNGQCDVASCPTRQVAGYLGTAVQFNSAIGMRVDVPDVDISAGDFGISFWFKTSQTTGSIFSTVDNSVNLYLAGGKACVDVKVSEWSNAICTTLSYADNKWHHLALSFQNITGGPDLYIDGAWVSGGLHMGTRTNPSPQSGVRLGYSYAGYWNYWGGLLDEVVVYDRSLTVNDVQRLYGRPLLAAHLDEATGATTFKEDGGLTGTCGSGTCPYMYGTGVVRGSAGFDGDDYIRFSSGPALPGTPFTLAAWVWPGGAGTGPYGIMGGLIYGLNLSQPTLVQVGTGIQAAFGSFDQFVQMPVVPNVLTGDAWNHVVLTYGPNQDGLGRFDLYVNGIRKGDYVPGGYPQVMTGAPFNVGDVWAGSTADPAYPAKPFQGYIDEVLVYPYALSEGQVDELYRNQADAMHLPFDEPPGTYHFQDTLQRATGSCPADLTTCPTAGVSGRAGQAAEFDGVNDSLDAGVLPAASGTGPLSVAAWVRTSAAKDQVIVQQRSATVSDGVYQLRLTAAGKVSWSTSGNSGTAGFALSSAKAVNDGKWHHVAAVREKDGSAQIYIDGTQDANAGATAIAPLVTTNVYVGADMRDRAQYFDGTIDELHVVRRALPAGEIVTLMRSDPRLLLHLEEAAGASSFADDTEVPHNAGCSGVTCPAAGLKGQVNLAAGFDGVDDGLLTSYAAPASGDKTVMAWVKPDSTSAGRHTVLSAGSAGSWSLFRDGDTWHVGTGAAGALADWDTGAEVRAGGWQHLAIVFSGNTARFFLNGHRSGDLAIGTHGNLGNVAVGYDAAGGAGRWDGRIDEVAIYERALIDAEVESLWLYQGQWVQEMHTTQLKIDNDKPVSDLAADSPYRPNRPVNLLIETSDATSAVVGAQWQVDGGTWLDAPPCQASLGAAWCPTFDPAAFHGAGVYTIRTQATDAAGNVSATSSETLYVDGTAPAVTRNLTADALVQLQPAGEPDTWQFAASGTVGDPVVVTGVPGSGVRSLKVTLLDAYGQPVGSGAQFPPIQNGSWNAVLTIAGPFAGGAYIVRIEADDQVGNLATIDTRIYLDQTAPEVSPAALPAGGAIVALHLDEAAGATQFADGSGYDHGAACGTACPAAGLAGKVGKAVELNGTSQSLVVSDALDIGSGDFTIAAWFQSSSATWQTIAAASTSGSPAQDVVLLRLANTGQVRYTFTVPGGAATTLTSPRAFNDGQWHQAAAVRRGGELLLYADGKIVASKADSRALSGPLRLALGQHSGAEFFKGRLDEAYAVPLALSGADTYSLAIPYLTWDLWAQGVVSDVPLLDGAVMELHLEEASSTSFADSSAWANDAACSGTTCPARVTSGTFFGQALKFDGVDDYISVAHNTAFDAIEGLDTVTIAAWVNINAWYSGGWFSIVDKYESAGDFGWALQVHNANGIRFWPGTGPYTSCSFVPQLGEWVHLALTYDRSAGKARTYVNGVQRCEAELTADIKDTADEPLYIGYSPSGGDEFSNGQIDEVYLFDRVLAPDEVLALAAKKHAGVAGLETAVVPASPGSALYNAPMPQGTQLYLPLDDTEDQGGSLHFLDISGEAHNVTCTDPACPPVGHAGHAGNAARFDGENDYLDVALDVSETAYALALWFKTTCATCGIFSVDSGTRGAGGNDRQVYLNNGNVCARVYSNEVKCTSGTSYADDRWHQVVHTFGGTEGGQKIYLDGALKVGGTKATSDFSGQDGINIGFANDAGLDYFSGLLDEVILFNQALPEAVVRALYLGTEPVIHMGFDERWAVDGSVLADGSGFGNDGALHGAAANHAVAGTDGYGALQLNGSSDYVTAARSIDFARGDYSVTAWVRTSAKAQQVGFSATNPTGDTPGIQLYLDSAGVPHFLHRAPTGSSGGTDLRSTGPADNNGVWHHLAGVKAGNTLTLYRDGMPYGTATASSGFSHALNVTVGRQGKTTAGAYLNGAVDDVRVYARALSAEELEDLVYNQTWEKAWPSPTGAGVVRSTYGTAPDYVDVEGFYRFDMRATDSFGNRSDADQSRGSWIGVFDNIYPRAELRYQITTVGSGQQVHYQFSAHDFDLVEEGFVSPCPAGSPLVKEYFNAPWYRAWTGQTAADSDRLWALSGQCDLAYSGTLASLTVYDSGGLQRTVSAKPMATAAGAPPPEERPNGILILEPAPESILTGAAPVAIAGRAYSAAWLRRVEVRVDGSEIYAVQWRKFERTGTPWSTTWTPSGEGAHAIEARMTDWAGGVFTDTVTVILDQTAPSLAVTTTVLTTTHLAGGRLTVTGTAEDAVGVASVEVQADGGEWRPATLDDGAWAATWTPDLSALPDGRTVGVVARATDRAGRTALASKEIGVDLVAPAPVDLAFSYQASGATQPITQTGTTIREPGAAVEMAWSASSDGSSLTGYRAGWTAVDAGGSATAWIEVNPGGARRASTTPGEGQKLTASLGSRDAYGNTTWQDFGPIYADSPLTPDYVALEGAYSTYRGWMDGGCSLLGVDRRLSRTASDLAMLQDEQALYATWDSQALRLAWSGANWSAEGDLFVFLDTVPGGSLAAFNPFTPTVAVTGTAASPNTALLFLPGGEPTAGQAEMMLPDYGVWVHDAQTAHLLSWDGSAWLTSTLLSEAQVQYQPSPQGGLTDLLLPFTQIGIADPAQAPLKLLAYASEEGALRLWTILPRVNPVTSLLAAGSTGHTLDALAIPLTHYYEWPSLGAGMCPNGSRALAAGQTPYPDAEIQVHLTADPSGITYHYLGDHLFPWARDLLLGDKPADFGGLLTFLDRDHPFVHDGQALRYTLRVQNSGRDTAHGVAARVWAHNALTLPGGAPLAGPEQRYYQEVAIGDLAPGEARTVTFDGRVDLAWARPQYEGCLAAQPEYPRLCALYLRMALLTVHIVDQTHTAATGPLERMWADHLVDFQAPRFVGISAPGRYISTGGVALSGYAYDDSGVPQLSLRVETPAGGTVSLPCPNSTPASGAWSCEWDPTAANGGLPPLDGQTFRVRLRGIDGVGQTGDLGPWLPFIVDTVPPTVTTQLPAAAETGLPASVRTLQLSGLVADNHGAAGVEVCLEGECEGASVALKDLPRLSDYADQPGAPVPLPVCGSGEVRRSFSVADAFAVRAVSLGLRAQHSDRDQIRADLIAPDGTHVRVLSGEGALGSDYQHYTLLLADDAAAALSQLGRHHDTAMAGFPHLARPDEPLSAFLGTGAAGTWTLVLCDTDAAGDVGSYVGGRLILQPQETGAPEGTWSQRLALPELDGVEQTVTVYGVDDAGNRTTEPFTHTLVVDNVSPQITITHAISEVQMAPDLAPIDVLTGTVTDGDRVRRLFAAIYTPEGQLHLQPVARDGQNWSFALQANTAGVYSVRIVAEDLAGNQTAIGPVAVEVRGILVEEQVHLPVILHNAMGGLVQEQLWLPVVLKGAGEEEQQPEAPELPAPSATVAVTPTLTLTPVVTVTVTLTPTVTPTATVTGTPTATITPTVMAMP